MPDICFIYFIIFIFFLIGGIGIHLTNRKKGKQDRRKNWLKYATYFVIANMLFVSIFFNKVMFAYLSVFIVFAGYFELSKLQRTHKNFPFRSFFLFFCAYTMLSTLFCIYAFHSPKKILLFTLFTVFTFDSFCQISGQLFGKRKMCPQISPNKTVEGFIGGLLISIVTSYFIGKRLEIPSFYSTTLGLVICLSSLGGDLAASFVKRQYKVKDFSSLLPGHGGFLDRFDSLIAAGASVFLFQFIEGNF